MTKPTPDLLATCAAYAQRLAEFQAFGAIKDEAERAKAHASPAFTKAWEDWQLALVEMERAGLRAGRNYLKAMGRAETETAA